MKSLVERAYELARSGEFLHVTPLKKRLAAEGYDARQINGASLLRSLAEACKLANGGQVKPPRPPRKLLTAEERSAAARRGAEKRLAAARADRRSQSPGA